MLKRVGILLLALATISGCYFPSDFEADIQIDRKGRYSFTYVGKLTDLSMAQRMARGDMQGMAVLGRAEIAERDLRRDSAFKKIQYEAKARFDVTYQRDGYIVGEKSLNFIRLNSRFLTLKYNKINGEITIIGGKPNKNHADALEQAGLEFNGVLRIWTNVQPKKHNSTDITTRGQLTVYTWDIKNVRQKVPIFKFVPQPQ